jgi:hypothetical protein
MGFTSDASHAATLALDAQSRLHEPSTGLYPNTDDLPLYFVYMETQATVDGAGYLYLKCSTDKGRFACTATSGGDTFFHCPITGPVDALVFGKVGAAVGPANGDCVALGVRPVCD